MSKNMGNDPFTAFFNQKYKSSKKSDEDFLQKHFSCHQRCSMENCSTKCHSKICYHSCISRILSNDEFQIESENEADNSADEMEKMLKHDLSEIMAMKKEINLMEFLENKGRREMIQQQMQQRKKQQKKQQKKGKKKQRKNKQSSVMHMLLKNEMEDTVKVILKQSKIDNEGNKLLQSKGYERNESEGIFRLAEQRSINNCEAYHMQCMTKDPITGKWTTNDHFKNIGMRNQRPLKAFHKKFECEFGSKNKLDLSRMIEMEQNYEKLVRERF